MGAICAIFGDCMFTHDFHSPLLASSAALLTWRHYSHAALENY
jgi:hypothetical protein